MKKTVVSPLSVVGLFVLHLFQIWLILSCVGCKRIEKRKQQRAPVKMPPGPVCPDGMCDPSKIGFETSEVSNVLCALLSKNGHLDKDGRRAKPLGHLNDIRRCDCRGPETYLFGGVDRECSCRCADASVFHPAPRPGLATPHATWIVFSVYSVDGRVNARLGFVHGTTHLCCDFKPGSLPE